MENVIDLLLAPSGGGEADEPAAVVENGSNEACAVKMADKTKKISLY